MGRTTRLACRRIGSLSRALLAAAVLVAASPLAAGAAPEVVGSATVATGRVVVARGSSVRAVAARDQVLEHDLVETGAGSAVSVRFGDGSVLTLGPGTRASVDRFAFDPRTGRGVLAIHVLAGAFEFESGAMNKDGYAITTPFAAVALRGTHIGVDVNNEAILVLKGEIDARFLTGETLSLKPSECTFRTAGERSRSTGTACGESFAAVMGPAAAARAGADALALGIQQRLRVRLPSPDKAPASPN